MHCRNCDYPLWNLKARKCPECGEPFQPGQFEFNPNSVRFCCPQCDKAYYGTDGLGHLVPREFDCVECGLPLSMDEMVLRPAEGVDERDTRVDRMPWLDRKGRSIFMAWLRTVGRSMGNPTRLMRVTPIDSGAGSAWGYAAITMLLILFLGVGLGVVAIGAIELMTGGPDAAGIFFYGFITLLVTFALVMAFIWLWGAVTHGILRLTGGAAHRMSRTHQAIAFGAGACVLAAVPCFGPYFLWMIGGLWWMISACFMVAEGQKVHGGRAALATLTFPVVVAVLVGGGLMATFFFGISRAQVAMTTAMTTARSAQTMWQAQQALAELHTYAMEHGGFGPAHAIQLVDGAGLTVMEFAGADTDTDTGEVPIADLDLDAFFLAGSALRRDVIEKVLAAQPPDVIAHRLGDLVFTHHGVDFMNMPGELWLIIVSPDPDQNDSSSISGEILVGRVDLLVEAIAIGDFAARLAGQNELRAAEGLAPLPDPATVTHAQPATAENRED